MSQPIELVKGNETMTVYGRSQAAVHLKEGWHLASDTPESTAAEIKAKANEPEPTPKTKRK